MIRTKYLFVTVCSIALAGSIFGVQHDWNVAPQTVREGEALFATPKDVYKIVSHNTQGNLRRSTFIASVRSALLKDLSEKKEEPVIIETKVPEVETPPTTPVILNTENYGDTFETATNTANSVSENNLSTIIAGTSTRE